MLINDQISDEKLIGFIIDSDQEAFAFIIDRYESKLRAYIRRLTNNSLEVDDLVQQTLVNSFISLKSFDQNQKFSSWIYRIAHNLAINWLKKKKINIYLGQDENLARTIKADIDIHEEVSNQESIRLISEAVNSLPEKFKEPIILKYIEDKTYDEISEIIRKPKNTIGTLISRAKIMLKKELNKTYDSEY